MSKVWKTILVLLVLCGAIAHAGAQQRGGEKAASDRPRGERAGKGEPEASASAPRGSLARQLHIKRQLQLARGNGEPSLAETIRHNRQEWESLTPEQRDEYRRTALAFLQQDPAEQDRMLKRYESLIKMSADKRDAHRQRAQWLKVVVESLTPEQRRQLQEATPQERAQRLLERKAELIREGKLTSRGVPREPATAPAATQPAEPANDPPAAPPAE